MDDVRVPLYYVVSRKLPEDQANPVLTALAITPCIAVIVSDVHDASLGFNFSSEVIRAATDAEAHRTAYTLSSEHGRPFLVIGEANFLDAIYKDGTRESVAHAC